MPRATPSLRFAIGRRLANLRLASGLSLSDVQNRCAVGRSHLSELENGHRLPGVQTLLALSGLYGVSVDYIIRGRGHAREKTEGEARAAGA